MVTSWDLTATGHSDAAATIAALIETHGRTGTGKTAKTATIKAGPEPTTAETITAATIDAVDQLDASKE